MTNYTQHLKRKVQKHVYNDAEANDFLLDFFISVIFLLVVAEILLQFVDVHAPLLGEAR